MINSNITGVRASHILRAIAMLRGYGYDVLVPAEDIAELTELATKFGEQFEEDLKKSVDAWDGIE